MTNFFGRVAFRSLSLGMVPGHGREDLGVGADCFASKTISQRTSTNHQTPHVGEHWQTNFWISQFEFPHPINHGG